MCIRDSVTAPRVPARLPPDVEDEFENEDDFVRKEEDDRSISIREMQIDLSLQKSNRLAQILDAIHAVFD